MLQYYFYAAMLLFMATGCPQNQPAPPPRTLVNLVVCDQSESADYINMDTSVLRQLALTDAEQGNAWLIGLRVVDKHSIRQKPLIAGPLRLDKRPLKGSIYQDPAIQQHNDNQQRALNEKIDSFLQDWQATLLDTRNLPYSDVNGCLQLAERLSRQSIFKDAIFRVIILSDLLHDQPDRQPLGSFTFPERTTVFVLGADPTVALKDVFPENEVEPLVSFHTDFVMHR